jgi:hypothetical protein
MAAPDENYINKSDARVFRELLLSVSIDIQTAMSNIEHAKRTCARMAELAARGGIGSQETPITDKLNVATYSMEKAQRLVSLGIDAGVMALRDVSDLSVEMVLAFLIDAAEDEMGS